MKHSGWSKKCVSYHVIYAGDNDMIWAWVGNYYTYLPSEKPSMPQPWLFSSADLVKSDWFVDIKYISSQRMILVKIVLFEIDHDTYNLRSIWFDLFIKRLIQGPRKSEWWECSWGWAVGSVSTKWPLLFFSPNLRFPILGLRPPLYQTHPDTPMIS